MSFIQGLHGTIAVVLICSLLFVDEAGVPLPIAPNEVMLLVAGVLIGSGGLAPWVFLPTAALAMLAGMVTGYTWARAAGQPALQALAKHIGAEKTLDRLSEKVRAAGPARIGVLRLLPGVRPHVTLVSGAAQVEMRTFLTGAIPALVVWLGVWTTLGELVGVPVEHELDRFERVAVRGGLVALLAVLAIVGLRKLSATGGGPLAHLPRPARVALALALDSSLVAAVVAGCLGVSRHLLHRHGHVWLDLVLVLAAIAVYLGVGRWHGGTLGERVLATRDSGAGEGGAHTPHPAW